MQTSINQSTMLSTVVVIEVLKKSWR